MEDVETSLSGAIDIAVSAGGSLAYVSSPAGGRRRQAVFVAARDGTATPLPGIKVDSYRDVRVSPEGTRLALATDDDIWIYDLARPSLTRLTTEAGPDTRPIWTPDGKRVIFRSV